MKKIRYTWEVEAKWLGGIEYEKAEIESPLKVAMMVARSLRAGCRTVKIKKKKVYDAINL